MSMPPEQKITEPASGVHAMHGGHLRTIFIIVILVAVAAGVALIQYSLPAHKSFTGSVTVVQRTVDGERALHNVFLKDFFIGPLTGADKLDESAYKKQESFLLADGSTITLNEKGIVEFSTDPKAPPKTLIVSPKQPTPRTIFTVWGEGKRIAWVNPGDRSLQVFERSERGVYVPIYLSKEDITPNSIGFNQDGTALVAADIAGESTDFYVADIASETIIKIGTMPGLVTIIEKI